MEQVSAALVKISRSCVNKRFSCLFLLWKGTVSNRLTVSGRCYLLIGTNFIRLGEGVRELCPKRFSTQPGGVGADKEPADGAASSSRAERKPQYHKP